MEGARTLAPDSELTHTVRRSPVPLGSPRALWDEPAWARAETIELTHWDWPTPGPETKVAPEGTPPSKPTVLARTMWDDQYLAVCFRVQDKYIRCRHTEWQDMVCRDSCCEFFVTPAPESDADSPFFNFEVNAAATMLLYHCNGSDCRDTTPLPPDDGAMIKMASSLTGQQKTAAESGRRIPALGWDVPQPLALGGPEPELRVRQPPDRPLEPASCAPCSVPRLPTPRWFP
jgi:hypothetical protein